MCAEQVHRGLDVFIMDGITWKPIRKASFTIAGAEGGKVARSWTNWRLLLTNKDQFYVVDHGYSSGILTESGPSENDAKAAVVHLNFALTLLDNRLIDMTSTSSITTNGYSSAVKVLTPSVIGIFTSGERYCNLGTAPYIQVQVGFTFHS